MNIKSEKGITGIDLTTALIIFIIGGVSIVTLYYNIFLLTAKIKIESTIIACLTDICETIDLLSYEEVDTVEKIKTNVIDQANVPSQYTINTEIDNYSGNFDNSIERITFIINYQVGNSNSSYTINKIKVKEYK